MRTDISSTLIAEQESLIKNPKGKATVERWLPEWSNEELEISTGYHHGHAAVVRSNNSLWRARVSPSGDLETAVYTSSAYENFESEFSSAGYPNTLIKPKFISNTPTNYGADLEIVDDGYSVTIFAVEENGDVVAIKLTLAGAYNTREVVVSLGTPVNSVQLASDDYQELYVMEDVIVEPSHDAWQSDIYGSNIRRFTYGIGWEEDLNTFMFHTHNKGTLSTDNGVTQVSTNTENQWGFRYNGGMAALTLDDNRTLIVFGSRFYWYKSYVAGTMGLVGFIYNKTNGVWRQAWQFDEADFEEDFQLWITAFVQSFSIEGEKFISWVKIDEPIYEAQIDGQLSYPRQKEFAISKISADGLSISYPIYCGVPEPLSGAIVCSNQSDDNKLYLIGYERVDSSPACNFFCTVPDTEKLDLELYSTSYDVFQNTAWSMRTNVPLVNADARFDTFLREGNIVRIYHGISGDLVQIGVGWIEVIRPTYSLERTTNNATMTIRAELQLDHIATESVEDWLPLQTYKMEPTDDGLSKSEDIIDGVLVNRSQPSTIERNENFGYYSIATPTWVNKFFAGVFEPINLVYRNQAYPQALTGGGSNVAPGVIGGPGSVAESQKTGSMFSDLFWMRMEPKVDCAIQAAFRMGDTKNANNFGFETSYGTYTSLDVQRSNGLITNILYRDVNNVVWNNVAQESAACGLIFRSVQDPLDSEGTAKKYIFMWEANSDLGSGSHLEDQAGNWWGYGGVFDQPDYGGLSVGQNKLYLIISDFDETDEDWRSSSKYVHKAILETDATDLTPGQPAELKLQVLGGTVYCFYRPYQLVGQAPYLWRKAFEYNTGHFGAGLVGCVTRGHNTILWDAFEPAKDKMRQFNNDVDVWNVEATDCTLDLSIKELIERFAFGGHTPTEFRTLFSGDVDIYSSWDTYVLPVEFTNFTIDLDIHPSGNIGELGIFFRTEDGGDFENNGVFLGLRFDTTYQTGLIPNCYAVLKEFSSGAEIVTNKQYSPSVIHLDSNKDFYSVRFSIRQDLAIVYVEGNYIGHFHTTFSAGKTIGLTGEVAHYSAVTFTELNEVPDNVSVNPSENMAAAISKVIGNRPIKAVFKWNGVALVSLFDTHDVGPELEDLIQRSSLILSDRFINIIRVFGAEGYATYIYDPSLVNGRRFKSVDQSNIITVEQAYEYGKRIVRDSLERLNQITIEMPMDIRIEPEDSVIVTVVKHDIISKEYYVEDVSKNFSFEGSESSQVVSVRQRYNL